MRMWVGGGGGRETVSCNNVALHAHEKITPWPQGFNIKIYFHLFCRLVPSLKLGQVLSLQLIVLPIFQHCVLHLSPNLVGW